MTRDALTAGVDEDSLRFPHDGRPLSTLRQRTEILLQ